MIWHADYQQRLDSWIQLRAECQQLDLVSCLGRINDWWFHAPWTAYYLHWDDRATWPDPWQLLSDNIFCLLARGLGIMYTVVLLERSDLQRVELVSTDQDNLVVIDEGKYILNWDRFTVVNINLDTHNPVKRIDVTEIHTRIK